MSSGNEDIKIKIFQHFGEKILLMAISNRISLEPKGILLSCVGKEDHADTQQ